MLKQQYYCKRVFVILIIMVVTLNTKFVEYVKTTLTKNFLIIKYCAKITTHGNNAFVFIAEFLSF